MSLTGNLLRRAYEPDRVDASSPITRSVSSVPRRSGFFTRMMLSAVRGRRALASGSVTSTSG